MNTESNDTFQSGLNEFLITKGYTAIQMEKVNSGHLTLEAKLNDVIGVFVLDTGASASVIEASQTEKFNLHTEELDEKGYGAGGEISELHKSEENKLEILDYTNEDFSVVILDLSHVNNKLEELEIPVIDGIIGADILTAANAIIDYSNLTLFLKNNETDLDSTQN